MALAYDRLGSGPPLVLLHGTNSSRTLWRPLLERLAAQRDVVAVDLPGHGASPPTSLAPPGFARDVAALLDDLGFRAPAVVGHSVGGWTALEVAKLGRAAGVLALTPAGFWRRHSPWLTDLGLQVNWRLGRLLGERLVTLPLRTRAGRVLALRALAVRAADVPYDVAADTVRGAVAAEHFPEHFAATRVQRFTGGDAIPPSVPVKVVWGAKDTVALARRSRFTDQLPPHAVVTTWARCGHMVVWDRPDDVVAEALALPPGP